MFFLQSNSQNVPLVNETLNTLLLFLNWIPFKYIFETELITTLVYKVSHLTFIVIYSLSRDWKSPQVLMFSGCFHYGYPPFSLCPTLVSVQHCIGYCHSLKGCVAWDVRWVISSPCRTDDRLCVEFKFILFQFLRFPMFRNVTLKCLTEIGENMFFSEISWNISCFFMRLVLS